MSQATTEDATPPVETPWGEVRLETVLNLRGRDGQGTTTVRIPTAAGHAVASFHVDPGETIQDTLRVVLLGGYNRVGTGTEATSGTSTLTVGGAPMGWRAQTYLDPVAGLPGEGTGIGVMLVDAKGRIAREFPKGDDRVREAVAEAFRAAVAQDPGFAGRIYAGLVGRMVSGLDAEVESATRALAEVVALRDSGLSRMADVEAAAEPAPAGPGR